jgi:SH3 domain protein
MKRLFTVGLLAFAICGAASHAQDLYVSDELVITFRTGPGSEYAISRNLASGARVEMLEELVEEGYARVRLQDGTEGWVLTRYLQERAPARLELEAATRDLAAERQRAEDLERRLAELAGDLEATTEALNATESSAQELNAELSDVRSASASALQTRQQNEQLRRQLDELSSQTQVAQMEIDELSRRERQNWFIIGAAVLLGGIIIGLIAPSLRPKRRSSW